VTPVGRALNTVALLLPLLLSSCGSDQPDTDAGASESKSEQSGENQDRAPGFKLKDLNGESVEFADYEGKLLLVDFWATWCGPCRRSIPHLVSLYQEYHEQGFEVVGISLDRSGPQRVRDFAEKMSIPYKIALGSREDAESWNTGPSIPVAFLVDRSGTIVNKFIGYQRKSVLDEEIRKYL